MVAAEGLPGLVYTPEGDAIVVRNGTAWYNRPLYCHRRYTFIWAGEMPSVSGPMGSLCVGIRRGGARLMLQQFAGRVARYRPARMEWELTDPRLPGLIARLTATTLADACGFAVRLLVEGVQPGDAAAWCLFPPSGGSLPEGEPIRFSEPAGPLEWLAVEARDDLGKAGPEGTGAGRVAWIPLVEGRAQCAAMAAAGDTGPAAVEPDPAATADPGQAFADGLARAESIGRQIVVDTPDPYLNAGVAASCAAVLGTFVEPCFVHGGSAWRFQQPGWRMMGSATAYGWHDLVASALAFWDAHQVKSDLDRTRCAVSELGCQQTKASRFCGAGFVNYMIGIYPEPHYEFQTQFFDEAVRAWRATGDAEFERRLLPMLELHLQRCKECFDPDDDGLYESYNNTWPSDSLWFNGGGTPEQSAYVYYGRRAAADMRRRRGDAEVAARHDAEADRIREAMNRRLWLRDKGHFASHIEQGGHRRVHEDAWVYAQHVPIEAGVATPEQTWRAMDYTAWAMERIALPYGGEMRHTSNFVPGMWSVRELYHGDNFAMALGYFLGGQGDEGWALLRGTMLQTMYGDEAPQAGFSKESNPTGGVNFRSPGGLSHPNCSIDFTDIVAMFGRAVVEGLFGYRPDYPNGLVCVEPALPSAWDRAAIRTPDFSLACERDTTRLTLARPARVRFRLPVRAERVKRVTVNGTSVADFRLEPWPGCGMLMLEVPACTAVEVALDLDGRSGPLPVRVERADGNGLRLARVEGAVPRYQVTQMRADAPEVPTLSVPAGARWRCLDVAGALNGDVRTIFRQDYRSPRPDTCSMRIGYDGWSAWTFVPWNIKPPEITLNTIGAPVTTPQGVPFAAPGAERNIAFTSLWDNWPRSATVPVRAGAEAVWLLVCGSTNPMQGRIANAVIRFRYEDGQEERLDLVPPYNFWSLCRFGTVDYDYRRDGFSLPKEPPPQVQLGENCRAMVYGWKLRDGAVLREVELETVSQDVVIGLMGVSLMNPR